MSRMAKGTVDELKRVLIPQQIRQTMGWDENTTLVMTVNSANRTITLDAAENCNGGVLCHMDDICRIELSNEVCESVNINPKDVLTLEPDVASGTLVISA